MHDPEDSPVTIRQLPAGTDDFLPLLKEIKISTENRIIIDCTPEKVMELLKQATVVNMMEDYQVFKGWMFTASQNLISISIKIIRVT